VLSRNSKKFQVAIDNFANAESSSEKKRTLKEFLKVGEEAFQKFNEKQDLTVEFVLRPTKKSSLFLGGAGYSPSLDTIILWVNPRYKAPVFKTHSNKGTEEIKNIQNFEKSLGRFKRIIAHELIHRAQTMVDGDKFSFWDFLKSKLSKKWYLENPMEMKAYGNTIAQEMASFLRFEIPEDYEKAKEMAMFSPTLEAIYNMLGKKKDPKKYGGDIIEKIIHYANKWLKHYKENLEELYSPESESPMYAPVRKKRIQETESPKVVPRLSPQRVASLYEISKISRKNRILTNQ